MALVALAASIFAGADTTTCLVRGVVAYVVGVICTQLWYVFFATRVHRNHEGG